MIKPELPPELHLILACLRTSPREAEARRIESLSRGAIDWPQFLTWVDRHRVAPLVFQNLSRSDASIPSATLRELRRRYERNARRALANAAELVRLYQLFRAHGVEVLPLKGSLLALQVYGDLARRHAGDIDLLVAPGQAAAAAALLQGEYRCTIPGYQLTPAQQSRYDRLFHHFEYFRDRDRTRLEVHWRLTVYHRPSQGMDFPRLLNRAQTTAVAGAMLPTMSLNDTILYLCAHGAGHYWARLFWLADLSEIIRGNPGLDWHHLLALAEEAGLVRPLVWGVSLAHGLLKAPLPEVIRICATRDRAIAYLSKVGYQYILCPDPETRSLSLSLAAENSRLKLCRNFASKWHALHHMFLGAFWQSPRLPDSLFFFHYVQRLLAWLRERMCGRPHRGDQPQRDRHHE